MYILVGYYMATWRYEISLLVFYRHQLNSKPFHLNIFSSERRDLVCSHSNGDPFTCKNNMLFLSGKITYFRANAHLVYSFGVYIIMAVFTLETDYPSETEIHLQNPSKLTEKLMDVVPRVVHPKLRPFHYQLRRIFCLTRIMQRIIRL